MGVSRRPPAPQAPTSTSTRTTAGTLRGKPYTEYVEEVKALKRHGRNDVAESLLLELVEVIEAEAAEQQWGVAPWYYEQLAIIYRKRKDRAAEVAILERYEVAPHAPGSGQRSSISDSKKPD